MKLWFKRGHRDCVVPIGRGRMVPLSGTPRYIGNREWCDGKARKCDFPGCRGRCCTCRHAERTTPPEPHGGTQ